MKKERVRTGRAILCVLLFMITLCAAGCGNDNTKRQKTNPETSTQLTEQIEKTTQEAENTEVTEQPGETQQTEQSEQAQGVVLDADGIPQGFSAADDTVWVTTNVNFREENNADSAILDIIPKSTEVKRVADSPEWAYVEYNGSRGFVTMDYVTTEEPDQGQNTVSAGNVTRVYSSGGGNGHGQVVVIDAGHQSQGDSAQEPNGPGSSTMKARVTGGTHGTTTGVYEYQLTLTIAQQLQTELTNRGYTVYMTRTSHDVNISNKERAEYANSVGADICIRIHANGADSSLANGALALAPSASNPYVADLSADSIRLSQCILNDYCNTTGMKNCGVTTSDTMTGINWCNMPVTILELGYMTNPSDDTNMENSDYQWNMVQGIANGVDSYFQ